MECSDSNYQRAGTRLFFFLSISSRYCVDAPRTVATFSITMSTALIFELKCLRRNVARCHRALVCKFETPRRLGEGLGKQLERRNLCGVKEVLTHPLRPYFGCRHPR